jgi:hypothetical protein
MDADIKPTYCTHGEDVDYCHQCILATLTTHTDCLGNDIDYNPIVRRMAYRGY